MDAATLGAKLPRDAGETLDRVWFRLEGYQVETDKGVEPLGARVEDNYDGGITNCTALSRRAGMWRCSPLDR